MYGKNRSDVKNKTPSQKLISVKIPLNKTIIYSQHSGNVLDWHSFGVRSILPCDNFYCQRNSLTQT